MVDAADTYFEPDEAYWDGEPDHRCPDDHQRCAHCGGPTACLPILIWDTGRVVGNGDIDMWACCDGCFRTHYQFVGGQIHRRQPEGG